MGRRSNRGRHAATAGTGSKAGELKKKLDRVEVIRASTDLGVTAILKYDTFKTFDLPPDVMMLMAVVVLTLMLLNMISF